MSDDLNKDKEKDGSPSSSKPRPEDERSSNESPRTSRQRPEDQRRSSPTVSINDDERQSNASPRTSRHRTEDQRKRSPPVSERGSNVSPRSSRQRYEEQRKSSPSISRRDYDKDSDDKMLKSKRDSSRRVSISDAVINDQRSRQSQYSLHDEVNAFLNRQQGGSYLFYPGTERLDYNYEDERNVNATLSIIQSIAHYTKGSLGVGILCMHEAYMYGGLWASLVGNLFVGIVCAYCSFILVKSAHRMYHRSRISALSYSDLAEMAADTGPSPMLKKHQKLCRHTVDLFLTLEASGTCCIYHIVIGSILKHLLNLENIDDIRIYMLLSVPLLLPLSLVSSIQILAPFSMLADIIIGISLIVTQYYSLRNVSSISDRPAWKDFHGYTKFLGICMYCVSGVVIALPVENNMKRPAYFNVVLWLSTIIVVTSIAITGFCGYLAWGENCMSPIVLHLPRDTFTLTLQVLLLIMLSVTYALEIYLPLVIILYYLRNFFQRINMMNEIMFRVTYFSLLLCVALANHDLILLLGFVGFFFHGIIAIAIPAVIHYLVTYDDYEVRGKTALNFCLFIFGMLCCIFVTYEMFISDEQNANVTITPI